MNDKQNFKIDDKREIKFINIDSLLENKNNIKIHTAEQIELIKKSVDKLGFNNVVIIDENNIILAGHARVQALKELEKDTVACLVIKDLTDSEKLQIMTIDNTSTLMTGIDEDMAKLVIEMLEISDADLALTGFSMEQLTNFKIDDLEIPDNIPIEKQGNEISRESVLKLTFGNRKVIITQEELSKLESIYDNYIREKGVDFGFLNHILGGSL